MQNIYIFILIGFFILNTTCTSKKSTKPRAFRTLLTKLQKYNTARKYEFKASKKKKYAKTEKLFRAAKLYIESNHINKAVHIFHSIIESSYVYPSTKARSHYLIFKVHHQLTDKNLLKLIFLYPNTVTAGDCLDFYVKSKSTTPDILINSLKNLWIKLKRTNLGDNILFKLYQIQKIKYDKTFDLKNLQQACSYLKRIIDFKYYFKSSLRDNAFFELAKCYELQKLFNKEIEILKLFLKTKQSSWFYGEYNSDLLDDAMFLLAQIYKKTKNFKKSAEVFHNFPKEFPYSRLKDDALKEEILINLKLNKKERSCKLIRKFKKNHKRSRFFYKILKLEAINCQKN